MDCIQATKSFSFYFNRLQECIYSGGMPRSAHGEKYTVSVMKTVEDRGKQFLVHLQTLLNFF